MVPLTVLTRRCCLRALSTCRLIRLLSPTILMSNDNCGDCGLKKHDLHFGEDDGILWLSTGQVYVQFPLRLGGGGGAVVPMNMAVNLKPRRHNNLKYISESVNSSEEKKKHYQFTFPKLESIMHSLVAEVIMHLFDLFWLSLPTGSQLS